MKVDEYKGYEIYLEGGLFTAKKRVPTPGGHENDYLLEQIGKPNKTMDGICAAIDRHDAVKGKKVRGILGQPFGGVEEVEITSIVDSTARTPMVRISRISQNPGRHPSTGEQVGLHQIAHDTPENRAKFAEIAALNRQRTDIDLKVREITQSISRVTIEELSK